MAENKLKKTSSNEEIKTVISEAVKEATKTFMKEIEELKKDRDVLMQSADKRALAKYYARNKANMPDTVAIRSIGGKVIMGWRMIEDRGSYQIPGTGKWTEYQLLEIIYQDKTTEKMTEMEFERKYEKTIQAKVIGTSIDAQSGEEALKVQRTDTGEQFEIGVKFVN